MRYFVEYSGKKMEAIGFDNNGADMLIRSRDDGGVEIAKSGKNNGRIGFWVEVVTSNKHFKVTSGMTAFKRIKRGFKKRAKYAEPSKAKAISDLPNINEVNYG